MRYRGPYEYDKFTLNILNYVNYVNDYTADMENYKYDINDMTINNVIVDNLTLLELSTLIDNAFEKCISNSEQLYKYFIMNKEGE
jgi:uncharacterized protein with HEPN domain